LLHYLFPVEWQTKATKTPWWNKTYWTAKVSPTHKHLIDIK
jgi:hypothetical protein